MAPVGDLKLAAYPIVRSLLILASLAPLLAAFRIQAAEDAEKSGRRFPQAASPPFWKGRVEEIEAAVAAVKAGKVRTIARSPGGRPVQLVEYGSRTAQLGPVNYGSAAGAGDPRHYATRPAGSPPTIFLVGPMHGHEIEGMVGLVNLIRVAETGSDLRGKEWPRLAESLRRARVLLVPVSNPDGRARCPYDSFVGVPLEEMTRVGQGTRKDGTLWGWPGVKARHPMKGDVGLLGAYFNDDGINLMHDDFFSPMAEETKALFRVAREEAPEYLLILHSHGVNPEILHTAYVPRFQKEAEGRFAARLMERYRRSGLPAGKPPEPLEDGAAYPPPSFNLTSALHHVCGGVAMLFECPHGVKETQYPQVTHEQILDLELILFEELLAFALEEPRPAPAPKKESAQAATGELLPNGIRLPSPWPPRPPAPDHSPPPAPAYLASPPEVIPIDLGRQLLVDDFLIQETTLRRVFHLASYHPESPVLKPDRPWEGSMAMVFSDGVWYDPKDRKFKMWYLAGPERATCYAESGDGIHWEKPSLDVRPGTNVVQTGWRDSSTVVLDLEEKDPGKRYKMFRSSPGIDGVRNSWRLAQFFSPDGIHWSDPPLFTGSSGDRTTVFWNPFRKVWVYSLRSGGDPRRRRYWETPDLVSGPRWEKMDEPPWWIGADDLDPVREDLKVTTQLYNVDAVAYESLFLGLFTIWRGQPENRQKPNDLVLGYSRDGWSWHRPDRRAFCPVSDRFGDWNYANVQSAGGCCLIAGDRLFFYVSGRGGAPGTFAPGTCVTGLATLRRDGFASMEAGEAEGTLTTRPVTFRGKHLFVNLDAPEGEFRAEVLDRGGRTQPRFTSGDCLPLRGDGTRLAVGWKEGDDLSSLAGKPVRFRFHLKNGKLYAFWVSPGRSGASGGYLAAGGPGYAGTRDTAGIAAVKN
jgi:hypothetical protein